MEKIEEAVAGQLRQKILPTVSPAYSHLFRFSDKQRRAIAAHYMKLYLEMVREIAICQLPFVPDSKFPHIYVNRDYARLYKHPVNLDSSKGRLKIGYVYSHFDSYPNDHSVRLICRFHDWEKFEIFLYAFGTDEVLKCS